MRNKKGSFFSHRKESNVIFVSLIGDMQLAPALLVNKPFKEPSIDPGTDLDTRRPYGDNPAVINVS